MKIQEYTVTGMTTLIDPHVDTPGSILFIGMLSFTVGRKGSGGAD
jgi:hypothetical protein